MKNGILTSVVFRLTIMEHKTNGIEELARVTGEDELVRADNTINNGAKSPSFLDKLRKGAASKYLAAVLALGAPAIQSCDEPVEPIEQVEEKKDTPEARAAFMADVVPRHLSDIATMEFDAVWVPTLDGKSGHYELQPKSMVDFAKAAQEIEKYAQFNTNKSIDKLTFDLYYENTKTRIVWSVPYGVLKEIGGKQNLNSDGFDKFRLVTDVIPDGGNPDATVHKGDSGFLRISLGQDTHSGILKEIHTVNPYHFGK